MELSGIMARERPREAGSVASVEPVVASSKEPFPVAVVSSVVGVVGRVVGSVVGTVGITVGMVAVVPVGVVISGLFWLVQPQAVKMDAVRTRVRIIKKIFFIF